MMRIHALQHVAFEGVGSMAGWARALGGDIPCSLLSAGEPLTTLDSFDCLVVMGGPMNIYQEDRHPWLRAEKRFIEQAIAAGKTALGICLGAQLIADVLGGRVVRNPQREIGWFPLTGIHPWAREIIPEQAQVMHWHGDTFLIPPGAERLARSEACQNQGFIFQGRVLGLQFHLETTPESLAALIENGGDDLNPPGPYVQSPEEMLADPGRFPTINAMMAAILDRLDDGQKQQKING